MRNAIIGCLIVVIIVLVGVFLFVACYARQQALTQSPAGQTVGSTQPTISITWPQNGARVKVGQPFQVHAIATDPRGIFSIGIAVDGQPGTPGTASPPITTFSAVIPITFQTKGVHTIAVQANSTTGAKSEPATIRVVAAQALSDPPAAGDPPTPVPEVPSGPPPTPPVDEPPPPPPPPGATVSFVANPTSIQQGQCSTLRWDVDGVREIYFEGVGVTGHEERQQCPTQTTTYTLRVVFTDGSAQDYTATVTVTGTDVTNKPDLEIDASATTTANPGEVQVRVTVRNAGAVDVTGTFMARWYPHEGAGTPAACNQDVDLTGLQRGAWAPALSCTYTYAEQGTMHWRAVVDDDRVVDESNETNNEKTGTVTIGSGLQPPAAPTNLRVTSTTKTTARLAWNDNSNNEDGFEISIPGGPSSTVRPNETQREISALACGQAFEFRVRAYNAAGNSGWSNEVTAQMLACDGDGAGAPAAPSNLRQNAVALVGKVALAWNDNSNNEDGFDIELVTDAGAQAIATVGANATTTNVDAPPCGTTQQFQVSARNAAGYSAASNRISVPGICQGSTVPAQPANFRVQSVTATAINLTWDDRATNETRFEVLQTGKSAPVAQTNANDHDTQILNSPCSQTLEFRVRACNAQGCSDLSNAASATTPACPSQPLVITGVKVTITPENFSGPCPYKVNLSGTISATGTGTVKYQWVLSGEAQSVHELAFDGTATKAVAVGTWTVKTGTHTARLKVLDQVGEPSAEDKIGVFCSN